ncbi:hypothetical protein DL770_000245 [Monosporascus sp. CRB-9-2]|nr:hypothetical protein DL770_000245 [Monosporascus sp. CRB-9-2]
MKTLTTLAALLVSSVTALPSEHYHPAQSSFDAILIAKEHHSNTGDIWRLYCAGMLTMDLVYCGIDTECARNGSVMAEDAGCKDVCSCETRQLPQILEPHYYSEVVERAHDHPVVELKDHGYTVADLRARNYTVVKRLRKHSRGEPKPRRKLSCVEPHNAACTEAGAATCSNNGIVYSSNADCVSSCMCLNEFSPSCSGNPADVERCLENTACSSYNNGTLRVFGGHQEWESQEFISNESITPNKSGSLLPSPAQSA